MELNADLQELLDEVDDEYVPRLSSRVNLSEYVSKIVNNASVFAIYENRRLSAFAAVYCNDMSNKSAYLTMIAVRKGCRGRGLALSLLKSSLQYLRGLQFSLLKLEVYKNNSRAFGIYRKLGFEIIDESSSSLFMQVRIE